MSDTMIRFLCPGCRKRLKAPSGKGGRSATCTSCGQKLIIPHDAKILVVQPIQSSVHAVDTRMSLQLRADIRDTLPFLAETFRVLVRLNPANIQIHNFLGLINTIGENTPRDVTAAMVGQAINCVDLSNAVADLDGSHAFITNLAREMVLETPRKLRKVWPSFLKWVPEHPWLSRPDLEAEVAADRIRRSLGTYRSDLGVIQRHFNQLREYYPRYQSIMTRSGVMDYIIGFAAGFFGGQLGVVGAQAWDDWRGKSDADFVQAFCNAVDQFTNAGVVFTQNTEAAVNAVSEQLLRTYAEVDELVVQGLEAAGRRGMDISRVYRALHEPDTPITEEESKQLFEIVFDNLRQQGYSSVSESNMRHVIGLVR